LGKQYPQCTQSHRKRAHHTQSVELTPPIARHDRVARRADREPTALRAIVAGKKGSRTTETIPV